MPLLSQFVADQRYQKAAPYIRGAVLDLGCNNAQVLQRYGEQIERYVGVERSPELVEQLRAHFPQATFHQRDLDRDRLALGDQFDCVLMIALIEHLFNQQFVMSEVAAALAPGGRVILTTPTPLGNDVVHNLGARLGLFTPAAADDHIVLYNRRRFGILAREIGLTLARHHYFQFGCNQLAILQRPATR